jgi:photosystem II stability/assembly factor-like uncharacterized protein
MKHLLILIIVLLGPSIGVAQWQQQLTGTDADFRGLCAVSEQVAWVSGTKGNYGRTVDGGKTWQVGKVPDADKLDFRDVEAFGDTTAYLMSAGPGEASRIYKTIDAGKTWVLQYKNPEPEGFLDAIAFWDENHGMAFGDPINERFQLLRTEDGGKNWKPVPDKHLPKALVKEGAFAASGTCLLTHGANDVWFCTGGARAARVFHSQDRGETWTVSETPIIAGNESAGIFSVAFRDKHHGIIVGGDYRKPDEIGANAAITRDGGKTWTLIEKPFPFRSGIAWAKDRWTAVGTSGSNQSDAEGSTWKVLDKNNYNSVAFTTSGAGWAAGPKGRVAKYVK